jgi:hypothetical protein
MTVENAMIGSLIVALTSCSASVTSHGLVLGLYFPMFQMVVSNAAAQIQCPVADLTSSQN